MSFRLALHTYIHFVSLASKRLLRTDLIIEFADNYLQPNYINVNKKEINFLKIFLYF